MQVAKENTTEIKSLLKKFMSSGASMKHEYNVSIEEVSAISKVENSKYKETYFSQFSVSDVIDNVSKEPKMLLKLEFGEEGSPEEGSTFLYEGDIIKEVDNNTLLIQYKSNAVLSILGKENLLVLYKK